MSKAFLRFSGWYPLVKNVSVLHQDERGIQKSIPDAREISRDPRYLPSFGVVQAFSSSSILSLGMDHEIHPCGQERIDSVKINPSLVIRE